MARTMVSLSRYFPVPTMRREWNVRPPTVKGVSRSASTAVLISTPSNKVHQLDCITVRHSDPGEVGAADDGAVVFHDHGARIELEGRKQLEEGGACRHHARLAVDRDVDGI